MTVSLTPQQEPGCILPTHLLAPNGGSEEVPVLLLLGVADLNQHQH